VEAYQEGAMPPDDVPRPGEEELAGEVGSEAAEERAPEPSEEGAAAAGDAEAEPGHEAAAAGEEAAAASEGEAGDERAEDEPTRE
jgi:hypothetical protein